MQTQVNREQWLTDLAKQVEPLFKGYRISPYRLTCGWPSAQAMSKRRRVGECHGAKVSKGGIFEIFISPILDESLEVAGTVCHEMAHVIAGIEARHGKGFLTICKQAGITKGKPTSIVPNDFLNEQLKRMIEVQGSYPHQAIVPVAKLVKPATVVKLSCECGCCVTISHKWLDEAGLPVCGCGSNFKISEKE